MGDQIGKALEGTLYYIPNEEFNRIQNLDLDKKEITQIFANMARLNTLYMIGRAGSGHIGSSFSSMDIVAWLVLNELRKPDLSKNDAGCIYFSSKGHDAPGYYAALIGAGHMNHEYIHKLRRIDGLPGHPDVNTDCMEANTGSLGMGISKAKGMVTANRLLGRTGSVYVMTGDGELQEGQFWESLVSAANNKHHEIVAIIDHNKLQSDTFVSQVSDLGDLEAKLKAFGWHVERLDGHDIAIFAETLDKLKKIDNKPKVIIADTIKGKGVSFMEHTAMESDAEMYRFHSGAPDADSYTKATQELLDKINNQLDEVKAARISLESIERPVTASSPTNPQRLIKAYSEAILEQAEKHPNLVALDADLVLDTGLIPFKEKHPERFIECGIAEQDMVSQAGGMALKGLLPVVHSFACFLSSRPNEQIYNNATEGTKIVYVGSLAGVLPGGPGHSHQAVRDISTMGAIPDMYVYEPSCEKEVKMGLDYAINTNVKNSYIRLVSIPWECSFVLPESYKVELGKGIRLVEGNDIVIIAYGPIMLSQAVDAAKILSNEHGINVGVINLPWLNYVDSTWFVSELGKTSKIISIDNHYIHGGQGDTICNEVARNAKLCARIYKIGLNDVPKCGTNDQVLEEHSLSARKIIEEIYAAMK